MGMVVAVGMALGGCATPTRQQADTPPPGPTYRGPDYLRGTVGSLTQLRNYRPLGVSGYGLVVGLNGTGSSEVPAFLREHMLNEMRKRGFGSANTGMLHTTPERVLADHSTAVVAVRGLIPPAAVKGTRFDVVVSALSGTQTTSLAGGRLYTTDLSIDGTDPSLPFVPTSATAHGSIYVGPAEGQRGESAAGTQPSIDVSGDASSDFVYNAVVPAGGKVTRSRRIALALNQPSWSRSRDIADRINERFPTRPGSTYQTADAKNDLIIQLHIPDRYADDPGRLIALIQHLFVARGSNFVPAKARELLAEAVKHPATANDVMLACQALGRTAVPVLRDHYTDPNMTVRMAALQAGARLGDERSTEYLKAVATSADPAIRAKVAEALAYLPNSLRGAGMLRQLLEDPDQSVQIAAYQALARMHDPLVEQSRVLIRDVEGDVKYIIDRVPSKRPLIYVTQRSVPRIVIFGEDLGFSAPMFASFWDGRLMLRQKAASDALTLFYQLPLRSIPPGLSSDERKKMLEGSNYSLQPTVATLAYMLGHHPTDSHPGQGLNFAYSQVVDVLYKLCKEGGIDAPIKIRVSHLVKLVSEARQRQHGRPMVDDSDTPIPGLGEKFSVPAGGASGGSDTGGADVGSGVRMQRVPDHRPSGAKKPQGGD